MKTFFSKLLDSLWEFLGFLADPPEWEVLVVMLKILSLSFSFFFLLAIFILLFRLRANIRSSVETVKKSVGASKQSKRRVPKEWSSVSKKLEAGDESNFKLAVIEADKILDDILKKSGYPGESMGDRLKQITSAQIANIDAIWQVHKIRNNIVHDPNFRLTRSQAENTVRIYQKALQELQAI